MSGAGPKLDNPWGDAPPVRPRAPWARALLDNLDLPLMLAGPVVAGAGLLYAPDPWGGVMLYAGGIAFFVALAMNHRKHRPPRG